MTFRRHRRIPLSCVLCAISPLCTAARKLPGGDLSVNPLALVIELLLSRHHQKAMKRQTTTTKYLKDPRVQNKANLRVNKFVELHSISHFYTFSLMLCLDSSHLRSCEFTKTFPIIFPVQRTLSFATALPLMTLTLSTGQYRYQKRGLQRPPTALPSLVTQLCMVEPWEDLQTTPHGTSTASLSFSQYWTTMAND